MYSYEGMREKHGRRVPQTVDAPVMVMDFWELSDVFLALGVILFLGVILNEWLLMFLSLGFCSIGVPMIKKRNPKGILFHLPYRYLGMNLPGFINPGEDKKYSN
ncbi:MAG: hypothetical protein HRU19_02905 [Pseudobacteriovorax sp.]|nr:hypothetical protein [Pseudobacteriovorax sp.]